jgi:hypothetical protein
MVHYFLFVDILVFYIFMCMASDAGGGRMNTVLSAQSLQVGNSNIAQLLSTSAGSFKWLVVVC